MITILPVHCGKAAFCWGSAEIKEDDEDVKIGNGRYGKRSRQSIRDKGADGPTGIFIAGKGGKRKLTARIRIFFTKERGIGLKRGLRPISILCGKSWNC